MKQKRNRWQVFWDLMVQDPGLVFFILSTITLVFTIIYSRVWSNFLTLALYAVAIFFYIRKHRKTAVSILAQKHLPVVVVAGKDRGYAKQLWEDAIQTITQQTGFKQFKQIGDFFNINFEDLLIHRSDDLNPLDPNQWKNFISRIQREIRQFTDRITGDKTYHIFIFGIGLTSLAIGLGAVFGTRSKVTVYQLSDEKWEPVLDLSQNIRRLKETKKERSYRYISVSIPERFTSEVALVLNLASHPTTGYLEHYLKEKGLANLTMVEVNNEYGGNLREKDWTAVVQEVFSVYSLIHEKGPAGIHLFHNMPTALAFGLGVALGIYNQVTVYCWDVTNSTYCPVFGLNELESLL